MRTTKSLMAAALAAVLTLLVVPGPASAEDTLPVPWTLAAAVPAQLAAPGSPPPGANDWSCTPSEEHPNPVVLTHGLSANQTVNWQTFSPLLANAGYRVFSLTYGTKDGVGDPDHYQPGGLLPMEESAVELSSFVDRVLDATDASEVDILGHSEGTLMPSYYVRFLDGESNVDKYVSLTPLWEGTKLLGLSTLYQHGSLIGVDPVVDGALNPVCESCPQFLQGSDYLKDLHSVGIFAPEVTYTNIVTKYDSSSSPTPTSSPSTTARRPLHQWRRRGTERDQHRAAAGVRARLRRARGRRGRPGRGGARAERTDPANPDPVPCVLVTPLGAARRGGSSRRRC